MVRVIKDRIVVLSATAILGYGFPVESFEEGLSRKPDVLAVDAGSTDPGPYYLGAGVSFTDRRAVKRDLALILKAGCSRKIPVIVGTAGGSGADIHLEWCLEIVREIALEEGLRFKLAVIRAEIKKPLLREKLAAGKIVPLSPGGQLDSESLEAATRVVGQMGIEPFITALQGGAEVIIAGRAYDPAVFAAYPIWQGFDPGLSLHMGKILECASIASLPGSGSDCMLGTLMADRFELEPLNPVRRCTTTSVAAHTLYEKTNPYTLPGPGGVLDLQQTTFEEINERVVRVKGSRFIPARDYSIKIEGARLVGYRTVSIAGARDPVFIAKVREIINGVRERVTDNFQELTGKYKLLFRLYGLNGVMGELEPIKKPQPHELGIIIETVAETQELADTICSFTRSTMLHYGFEGRLATAGNLAFPYSPSDFKAGEVYQFAVHHLVLVDDPQELFPVSWELRGG
ncbi:MAG: acyclic terpene utilization AtuA family protein [Desulfitobacteriaceae bacterium]|nr:acyclic terpene utilization AtuA family protein [Desulfitobacteriaceae bacterium]MDD4345903.1 acyclic terpene utilization AtuA family protein [Desulfitobacteriaceae bacterium]